MCAILHLKRRFKNSSYLRVLKSLLLVLFFLYLYFCSGSKQVMFKSRGNYTEIKSFKDQTFLCSIYKPTHTHTQVEEELICPVFFSSGQQLQHGHHLPDKKCVCLLMPVCDGVCNHCTISVPFAPASSMCDNPHVIRGTGDRQEWLLREYPLTSCLLRVSFFHVVFHRPSHQTSGKSSIGA